MPKKLIALFTAFIFLVFPVPLSADPPKAMTVKLGISTAISASGTGTFTVLSSPNSGDVNSYTVSNLADKEGDFAFQITDMTMHVGNDHSTTFDIYYKETLSDNDWDWTNAPAKYLISDMAVSGNTTYVVHFFPDYTKNMRFYCVEKSGATEIRTINATLQVR